MDPENETETLRLSRRLEQMFEKADGISAPLFLTFDNGVSHPDKF